MSRPRLSKLIRTEGVRSVDLLHELGWPSLNEKTGFERPGLRFESYPGLEHSVSAEEIEDMREWLVSALR